jgi:hypothetical protein
MVSIIGSMTRRKAHDSNANVREESCYFKVSKLKLLEQKPLELKTKKISNFRSPKIIHFNL